MEHVGRLGGTPYVADAWELELDPAAGLGFSALHAAAPRRARRRSTPRGSRRGRRAAAATPELADAAARRRDRRGRARARRGRRRRSRPPSACLAPAPTACCSPSRTSASPSTLPRGVEPLLPRIAHDDELAARCSRGVRGGRASRRATSACSPRWRTTASRDGRRLGPQRAEPVDRRGAARARRRARVGVPGALRTPARRARRGVARARGRARVRPARS